MCHTFPHTQCMRTILSVSLQAKVFSKIHGKPSALGSTTETDALMCEKALSISSMSNHITALDVWCPSWLLSGIWGSVPASRVNSGWEKAALYVCACVSQRVRICMPRLRPPQDWCWRQNESQSVCYSIPAAYQEVSREREKDREIIKTDHKSNINGW